jgi:integrase
MPKCAATSSVRIPSYRRHKSTGQAVVTIDGRDFYLGRYGSPPSRVEYNRLIAEWTAGGAVASRQSSDGTVAELMAAFHRWAKTYHTPRELEAYATAMRPLKKLYARSRVADFGPRALKAVRQLLIEADLARTTINQRVNRIRHLFKWGVENEYVPSSVLHGLQAVAGLRFGKTQARETDPVRPVPEAFVDAIIPYVSPPVAAMIELQRITGMRSGEATAMRGADISMSTKVWTYTPEAHKTAWRGHQRTIYLGPRAQEIIKPFLRADTEAYLFSPADAVQHVRLYRQAQRKTPLSCGNRAGTNRKRKPRKQAGLRYDPQGYHRAIKYGIERANKARLADAEANGLDPSNVALVPHWHPHQLRHNAATALRREHGIEVARIILGHRSAAITEVYAEVDHARAIEIMAKIG